MKKIDSDALGVLTRSMGLSGAGSPITELTDGVVDQSLSVNEVVRRGRTQARTEGIYTAKMRAIHTAANSVTVTVNPYEIGVAASVIAPYPSPMPAGFDIWLLTVAGHRVSGGGNVNIQLLVNYATTQQGWGVDNVGAAVVGLSSISIRFWDTLATTAGTVTLLNTRSAQPVAVGIRLPRSLETAVVMASTSTAIATFELDLVLGVFPTSLGQDGLV